VSRFIIICNYVSKIIEPLHSRCSKFRFQPVGGEFQKRRLLHICEQEKVRLTPGAIDKLIVLSDGDMRCAVNMLQTAKTFYDEVSEDALVEVACSVPESKITNLVQRTTQAKSTDEVTQAVKAFLLDGYSGQQALSRLLDVVVADPSLSDLAKAKCAGLFSLVDERLTTGCDEELQFLNLCVQMRPLLQAR